MAAAVLLVSINTTPAQAQAQDNRTYVDVRKPLLQADLASAPGGRYDTPQAAFQAYQAYVAAQCPALAVCQVQNLRACATSFPENQDRYYWGYPFRWCHDYYSVNASGQVAQGVTSVISVSDYCPVDYAQRLVTASGNGSPSSPWYLENRCEKSKPTVLPNSCSIGNPIYPATGKKLQVDIDYESPAGLKLVRRYDSDHGSFRSDFDLRLLPAISGGTGSCLMAKVVLYGPVPSVRCFEELNHTGTNSSFTDGEGVRQELTSSNGSGTSTQPYFKDRVTSVVLGGATVALMARTKQNHLLAFSTDGRLLATYDLRGQSVSLSGSRTGVLTATDPWGRTLQMHYDNSSVLRSVTDPNGQIITYAYASLSENDAVSLARARVLQTVTFQDQSQKTYTWDETSLSTGTSSSANRLTGIVDELGHRYASFGYLNGSAISTEHAGGVDRYVLNDQRGGYSGNILLTYPLGTSYTTTYAIANGVSRIVASAQPAGSGCAASSNAISYDANGNVTSKDDFIGKRTCHVNDLSRNLEAARVEGLSTSIACGGVTPVGASLPAGSRKTSTQWHPDWRLKTKVAEPGRIITTVYNGQPDPFVGNTIAICAPTSAQLPDGKPIVVACKRVEQATTDANGGAGFTAALQSGVSDRVTTWTYNQWGQVLTENGPRTDVNDTTTYTYYTDTSFTGDGASAVGHFPGDLATVTDAAGRVTQYTLYNKHGQLIESIDPNGALTRHAYDLRQRLLSTTVAGQTTSYTYDAAGQLKRVTLPDASWIGYEYDDAHRQIAVYDHRGNRIDYTLDNAGNRINEQVKDQSGALKRQLARSIDALGRIQQATGRD